MVASSRINTSYPLPVVTKSLADISPLKLMSASADESVNVKSPSSVTVELKSTPFESVIVKLVISETAPPIVISPEGPASKVKFSASPPFTPAIAAVVISSEHHYLLNLM